MRSVCAAKGAPPNRLAGDAHSALAIPRKHGYMRKHVERGSRPIPTASAGAAGEKLPFPPAPQLLEETEPQTGFPASGFHHRAVGADRGSGVVRSETAHQVAGGQPAPCSARMVSGGGAAVWSLPRRCIADSCSRAFSTIFSAMPQRRRASSSSSP